MWSNSELCGIFKGVGRCWRRLYMEPRLTIYFCNFLWGNKNLTDPNLHKMAARTLARFPLHPGYHPFDPLPCGRHLRSIKSYLLPQTVFYSTTVGTILLYMCCDSNRLFYSVTSEYLIQFTVFLLCVSKSLSASPSPGLALLKQGQAHYYPWLMLQPHPEEWILA